MTATSICLFYLLSILIFFVLIVYNILLLIVRLHKNMLKRQLRRQYGINSDCNVVGFFHPHCNSKGGGERVLWTAVKSMCEESSSCIIVIYTGDSVCLAHPARVFEEVELTFGITISKDMSTNRILFSPLKLQCLLAPSYYPVATLICQALASMIVAFEAVLRCPVDVFIDTTGFAFTLPIFYWLCGSRTAAYVHYPTISSDMLSRVHERSQSMITYNNPAWIRDSNILTQLKVLYYMLFMKAYAFAGCERHCHVTMTNSTWTQKHIKSLWGGSPVVLYPPCPTLSPEEGTSRRLWIISVGQFRPEKNYELQLDAFRIFLAAMKSSSFEIKEDFRLVIVGGCRGEEDFARAATLQELAREYGIASEVEFCVNLSYTELKRKFSMSLINLHTMVDEHFGIGVVEGMASGLITVANNSGGPLTDIIGPEAATLPNIDEAGAKSVGVGFLASSANEYAKTFEHIFTRMSDDDLDRMRMAASKRAEELFSVNAFNAGWSRQMVQLGL